MSALASLSSGWRRRLWLWLPALLLFVANIAALVVFEARFAGRAEVSEEEVTAAERELATISARRQHREAQVAGIDTTRAAVNDFYQMRLATEQARLTKLIAEVKRLAELAKLRPSAINYPSEAIEDYGLRKRSFAFQVQGSYADLRKFINLLELSDSFLVLERVSLSDAGNVQQLRIELRLSTLFSTDGSAPLEGRS